MSTPSLFLYYNERSDEDGNTLHWPGGPNGLPFRGAGPGAISQDEYEALPVAGIVRTKVFFSDDPEAMREYCDIRGRELNGMYVVKDRIVRWDEARGCERIFMEWAELAYGAPNNTGPKEGPAHAINGPFAPVREGGGQFGPPGMQLEQGRRR